MAKSKNPTPDTLLAAPFAGVPAVTPKQNGVALKETDLKGNYTSRYSGAPKSEKDQSTALPSGEKPLSEEDLAYKRFMQLTLMGANKAELTEDLPKFDRAFEESVRIGEQEFKSREDVAKSIDKFAGIADIARGKSRSSGEYHLDFNGFPTQNFSGASPSGSWNKLSLKPAKIDKSIILDGSFEQAFQIVLASEGGFANHAADRGGATIYGIASKSNPKEYETIMRQLARGDKEGAMQTTMATYKSKYWDLVPGIENMSPSARLVAFDAAINHGVGFTSKMVKSTNADADAMIAYRSEKYASIIERDSSQAVFEKGWGNRLAKLDALTNASERNTAVDSVLASAAIAKASASSKADLRKPAPEPA